MLILDWNSLTGTIPSELGNLSNLTWLYLHSNQLCGKIPSELMNLTKLSYLRLQNNNLINTDTDYDADFITWLDQNDSSWRTQNSPAYCSSQLQLSATNYNVNEGDGGTTITITRTNSSDGTVSVDYATTDDSATAPDDYTQTSGTLNWNDGDNTDKTITIDITDDSQVENDETLIVSLGNPTGGAELGEPNTATVTIKDNEGTVILTVEPPESNIYVEQEFDVNILVKAGTQQVDGASAYLWTMWRTRSITDGNFTLNLTLDNSFDNGAGIIDFAAGKLTAPFPDGDFELVTISLKAAMTRIPLGLVYKQPRRTYATFGGASVFEYAEDGNIIINKYRD
jgi:hypothetical protein